MSYLSQKTIKAPVSFKGVALHSGLNVRITIKPAEPNLGIIFKRVDLKENNLVYPNFMNVTNTSLNTTIENEFGVKVSTIEHLMGALFGLGIDNALIEINNEEVPILDGSAKEFIKKTSEFTVNIALIEEGVPTRGIVYAPAIERLFYTDATGQPLEEKGSFKEKTKGQLLPISVKHPNNESLIVVASKSHRDKNTDDYISKYSVAKSALNFYIKNIFYYNYIITF